MRTAPAAFLAVLLAAAPACAEGTPAEPAAPETPAEAAPESESAPVAVTATGLSYAEAAADTANWRTADPANVFVYDTTKGRVVVEALPDVAPAHVAQFRKIIRSGKLEGTKFHRVLPGFMAQGGDIRGGSGEPDLEGEFIYTRKPAQMQLDMVAGNSGGTNGYYLGFPMQTQSSFLAEMNTTGTVESWIPHCESVVSTARTDDPNSANSQFFWMRGRAKHLDREYTAWGRIVSGQDVVKSIRAGSRANNGSVAQPDILTNAQVAADMGTDAPKVLVKRTDSAAFRNKLQGLADGDVCDLPPVPAIVE